MRTFADFEKSHGRFVVCDSVCPTKATRGTFDAAFTDWMDTKKDGRFEKSRHVRGRQKELRKARKVNFNITLRSDATHNDIAEDILQQKNKWKATSYERVYLESVSDG